jgi:GT2 family glycosyltransferase
MSVDGAATAIVVTYRTGPVLFECLERLRADPLVAATIVVNNGNPPDVETALRARGDIVLIEGQGNVGFGRACNLGAQRAATAYLLFVNPDVVLGEGAVTALIEAGEGAPHPWIAGARLIWPDGREQRGGRRDRIDLRTAAVSALGLGAVFRDPHRERDPLPAAPIRVGAISGAAFLTPRADFETLGGFDERYFLHVEDIDLCRRAEERGGAVIFQPKATALHHRSTSEGSRLRIEMHKAAGFAYYFKKSAKSPGEKALAHLAAPAIAVLYFLKGVAAELMRALR